MELIDESQSSDSFRTAPAVRHHARMCNAPSSDHHPRTRENIRMLRVMKYKCLKCSFKTERDGDSHAFNQHIITEHPYFAKAVGLLPPDTQLDPVEQIRYRLDKQQSGALQVPWSNEDISVLLERITDLDEVLKDKRRLTREVDELLNGKASAAKQAAMIDLTSQLRSLREELKLDENASVLVMLSHLRTK